MQRVNVDKLKKHKHLELCIPEKNSKIMTLFHQNIKEVLNFHKTTEAVARICSVKKTF